MMVICGNSVEELEEGLDALKQTLRAGATCGVGGSSLEDVEMGLAMLKDMTCPKDLETILRLC